MSGVSGDFPSLRDHQLRGQGGESTYSSVGVPVPKVMQCGNLTALRSSDNAESAYVDFCTADGLIRHATVLVSLQCHGFDCSTTTFGDRASWRDRPAGVQSPSSALMTRSLSHGRHQIELLTLQRGFPLS